MQSTKVSALISTCNRPKQIEALLDNLSHQKYLPFEVIIIDASDDQRTELVIEKLTSRSNLFALKYFKAPEKGLTKQRNFGIDQASGMAILMLDDDVILDKDFLRILVEELERDKDKRVGGISGIISNSRPTLPARAGFYKLFGIDYSASGKVLRNGYNIPVWERFCKGRMEVEWLQGGLTLWRSEVFLIEGYSRFFENWGYAEDAEFSLRVGRKYKLICTPEAKCQHLHVEGGRGSAFTVGNMVIRNRYYIFKKHVDNKRWWEWLAFYWALIGVALMFLMGRAVRPQRWDELLGMSFGICWGLISSWYYVEKEVRQQSVAVNLDSGGSHPPPNTHGKAGLGIQ